MAWSLCSLLLLLPCAGERKDEQGWEGRATGSRLKNMGVNQLGQREGPGKRGRSPAQGENEAQQADLGPLHAHESSSTPREGTVPRGRSPLSSGFFP